MWYLRCQLPMEKTETALIIVLLSGNAIWRHFLWLRSLLFALILVIAGSCTQGHADSCSARKELLWLTLAKYFFVEERLSHSEIQTCDLQFSSPLLKHSDGRKPAPNVCSVSLWHARFYLFFALHFGDFPETHHRRAASSAGWWAPVLPGTRSVWAHLRRGCHLKSGVWVCRETQREANSRTDRDLFMCPPDLLCCVLWMSYVSLFPSVTNAESHGTVALPS